MTTRDEDEVILDDVDNGQFDVLEADEEEPKEEFSQLGDALREAGLETYYESEREEEELVPLGDVLKSIEEQKVENAKQTAQELLKHLRRPPAALDAERALLGGVLLDSTCLGPISDVNLLPEDFYKPQHGTLFEVIRAMHDTNLPIDTVTVYERLETLQLVDVIGGAQALARLEGLLPTSAHAKAYARIIKEKSILRQMITAATKAVELCYLQEGNSTTICDLIEREILAVRGRQGTGDFITIKQVMKNLSDKLAEMSRNPSDVTGLATGFTDLDKLTSGLQPGELVIVAARPSMGKCLAETEEIMLSDGSVRSIRAIVEQKQARLLSLNDDTLGFALADASAFIDDGVKPVYRVRTSLGREVQTTLSHPFRTYNGWMPLHDLKVGDQIAVPRRLPCLGTETLPDDEVSLMGLFAFGKIPLDAEEVRAEFGHACSAVGDIAALLKRQGLRSREHDISIPDSVFRLTEAQLVLYVNRLFAVRGRFRISNSGGGLAQISTSNQRLAKQIQHLLLRLGVVARLQEHLVPTKGPSPLHVFVLYIAMPESVLRLCAIGALGQEAIVEKVRVAADTQWRASAPREVTDSSDICWDEIVEIESVGDVQVYDLTVPGSHNFVANDVCVHNTAITLNLCAHIGVRLNQPVAFFSLEMGADQLGFRLAGSESRVDLGKLKRGMLDPQDWGHLGAGTARLYDAPIYIYEGSGTSIGELKAATRRLHAKQKLGVVMIDYLQLMRANGKFDNKATEVGEISKGLKELARELNIPVIALSQLNRGVESRNDKRPMMSDLRESGAIEQDADLIAFLYREEYYLREKTPEDKLGVCEVIVAKHRNGPVGTIELFFQPHLTRFDNLSTRDDYAP